MEIENHAVASTEHSLLRPGPYPELTDRIIGAAYAVQRELGCGFLEKVYENALLVELRRRGLLSETQTPIPVRYKGVPVGNYFADVIVEGKVIVEIKTVESLAQIHYSQVLHYLRATGIKVGLLLNFATPRVEVKRFVN